MAPGAQNIQLQIIQSGVRSNSLSQRQPEHMLSSELCSSETRWPNWGSLL